MIRGFSFEYNLLYFMGDVRSNRVPDGVRSLPIFVPVGTQVPIAAGFAWALRRKGEGSAVLAFMGDGATSEGDFHEGMNFAGVMGSPVVLISQNNQWAISVPRSRQTASDTIAQKAVAYGFPGILVDGNDVLAMYIATKEALDRARSGGGPTFIEAYTFRRMMHTTADDPTRYRTPEVEAEWDEKDPIKRFRIYLQGKGIWTEEWQKELEKKADELIRESVKKAEATPDHEVSDLFDYLYSEIPRNLRDQKEYLLRSIENMEIEEDATEIQGGFP
jgi:pyruvate dehydrogenase E1 component alpha subunit